MSSLTRTAAKTRARYLLAEPTARFYTEANLNDWCNDAVSDISLRSYCYQFKATPVTTTNGTSNYVWPISLNTTSINTIGVKTIVSSANLSFTRITPDLIGKVSQNPNEVCWCSWGREVILSPTPTAAYSITLFCWGEAEQAGAGTLNLPQPFHHLVPLYMAMRGFEAKRDIQMAMKYYEMYNNELNAITQSWHIADNPGIDHVKPGVAGVTVGQ